MDGQPLVAVVILHWGSAEITLQCVQSVFQSDYENMRLILVDNCPEQRFSPTSTDIPEKCVYICNPVNNGYCCGNNIGIVKAQELGAKFILLLNNDTIIDKKMLEEAVAFMEGRPEIAVVSPKILFYQYPSIINSAGGEMDMNTGEIKVFGYNQKESNQFNVEKDITFAIGCALFARSWIFEKIGLFDEDLYCYGEDVDLSHRIISAGYRMKYYPKAKVWHRHLAGTYDGEVVLATSSHVYYDCRNILYNLRRYLSRNRVTSYGRLVSRFLRLFMAYGIKHRRFDLCHAMLLGVFDCINKRMGKREPLLSDRERT
jgi:GT2 family glycosyltransferase